MKDNLVDEIQELAVEIAEEETDDELIVIPEPDTEQIKEDYRTLRTDSDDEIVAEIYSPEMVREMLAERLAVEHTSYDPPLGPVNLEAYR